MNAEEERQFATLVQAVLALQEAERKWGPDDLIVLQAKERLFEMANNFILGLEPQENQTLSKAEQARIIGEVGAERTEYAVSETPVGDAVSPEWVSAAIVLRVAIESYPDWGVMAADLKGKVEDLLNAASDLAGNLAHEARSVGLAVGEAGGRAVAQVAGEAALRAVRSPQVEQQPRPPQRDGGIEISGP